MGYFIGIDLGASFIKSALFDLEKLEIKNIVKYDTPTPVSSKNNNLNNRFEVDPDHYEKTIRKIIKKLLNSESNIDGIVFSTQMHGMVLVNHNLNPITPFIGWQDERLLEKFSNNRTWLDLLNEKLKNVDKSNTGILFRSGLMGSTLFWLKENGFFEKHKNLKALFLGDYIAAKLTNGKILVHTTNACGSGLFDVEKNHWNRNIIKKLRLNENCLPQISNTLDIVGYVKHKKKEIPVFVSVGDLQATVLGTLINQGKNRSISINIGTGSQMSFVSSVFNQGNYDIRSYFDNNYLYTITFIPAGRALNVITRFIEGIGDKIFNVKGDAWSKLINLVSVRKDSNNIKGDISFFENSISTKKSGYFMNITEKNFTIENLFFSALENMAENFLVAYKRLGAKKTDRIIISGGLIRKIKILKVLLEKKINKKILFAPFEEEALAGLLILSLVCSGKFTSINEASLFVKERKIKIIK